MKILVVIDVQEDYIRGSLANPLAEKIIPVIKERIIQARENHEMVRWFLKEHPFTLESLAPFLPEMLQEEGMEGMLQLFPGIHETDGFFLARMRRKGQKYEGY